MKKILFLFVTFFVFDSIFAQEALKSTEEEYYDFLSLQGLVERPTLGYRTLSDSEWKFAIDENGNSLKDSEDNIWKENNLGTKRTLWESGTESENWFLRGIDKSIKLKIYGPEWFNSYNTAAPYGQNDGALWQGKGYNTSLTAGARLEGYGFALTVKPQVSFSQNKEFELMNNSAYYTNKYAYIWGYGNNVGADAPQRFGDSSFWSYDWGDTEFRWSWKTFTLGFGSQAIWLGPAWLNPLLHSNNAATYPKFDIGLRKTQISMPYFGWNLGYIEARIWIGQLTESDYFDKESSNDHNQITGMTFSYSPSFLPGLVLGINKICLSKWDDNEFYKYLNPLYGMGGASDGNEVEDQKISFTADWLVPKGGIDVYAEFGIDDHINGDDTLSSYITHYWHTFTYTFGLKKELSISKEKNLHGEVIFEWNNTEMSQDMYANWPTNFGFHHAITQGYTNKGQWLGSGVGYGGQSQFLAFKLYYSKGTTLLYLHRYNPDNNFLFKEAVYDVSTGEKGALHARTWNYYKGILSIGVQSEHFINDYIRLGYGLSYARIVNPLYNQSEKYDVWNNLQLKFSGKLFF